MNDRIGAKHRSTWERRALIAFQLLVMVYTGWMFAEDLLYGGWWQLSGVLFAYTTLSLVCQFGWILPCVAIGTVMGILADAVVKGGSVPSQMRQTLFRLVIGILGGLFVGVLAELISFDMFAGRLKNWKNDAVISSRR